MKLCVQRPITNSLPIHTGILTMVNARGSKSPILNNFSRQPSPALLKRSRWEAIQRQEEVVSSSRRVVTVDVPSSVPSHGATGRLEGSAQARQQLRGRTKHPGRQRNQAAATTPTNHSGGDQTSPKPANGPAQDRPNLGRCSALTTKLVATSLMTSPLNNVCSNCRVRTESFCLYSAPRCDNATKFCFETGADGS